MSQAGSKLSLQHLSCVFGNYVAVDDVNLDVQKGEFISLLGPSGCGKTTTLRMIAGFIKPTDGHIRLNSQIVSSSKTSLPPERRNMSMIFQSYAVWPNMTVAQNVAFGLKLRGVSRGEAGTRVAEVLQLVKLDALAERYPSELSGGQQQRVALARAIVVKPDVLLLDEPLSNLDANLREEMRTEIKRLHRLFEMTTIYVTHDQSEAMTTSDRIVVMSKGKIEQIDDPVSLYRAPKTRFVASFIGRTNFLGVEVDGDRLIVAGIAQSADSAKQLKLSNGIGTVSIRPQDFEFLAAQANKRTDGLVIPCKVTDRSYQGESWDYTARLGETETSVHVSTHPKLAIPVGTATSLFVPFAQIVPITD
ncbi:ABC transporter ATP-binding protein [Mesorhizobium sp. 1B3]|uniref:ABC transporter ATP-binding protein n=1 Tax=Mesorhizobium sp. 1B3 TaxID=3243599 RepID=UPI003D954DFD